MFSYNTFLRKSLYIIFHNIRATKSSVIEGYSGFFGSSENSKILCRFVSNLNEPFFFRGSLSKNNVWSWNKRFWIITFDDFFWHLIIFQMRICEHCVPRTDQAILLVRCLSLLIESFCFCWISLELIPEIMLVDLVQFHARLIKK